MAERARWVADNAALFEQRTTELADRASRMRYRPGVRVDDAIEHPVAPTEPIITIEDMVAYRKEHDMPLTALMMEGTTKHTGDEPSVEVALQAFAKESFDLRELMVALTKTRTFTHRTPSTGEVLP